MGGIGSIKKSGKLQSCSGQKPGFCATCPKREFTGNNQKHQKMPYCVIANMERRLWVSNGSADYDGIVDLRPFSATSLVFSIASTEHGALQRAF